jgi:hypothetical protein
MTGNKAAMLLKNRKLVICNELCSTATSAGKKTQWDTVKSRITDFRVMIRGMYKDYEKKGVKNVCNYIFCSNHADSILIEEHDRRYFCLEVDSSRAGDNEYFGPLWALVSRDDFRQHLLAHFMSLSTEGLNTQVPVMTELKQRMIQLSIKDWQKMFFQNCRWGEEGEWYHWENQVWKSYMAWLDGMGIGTDRCGLLNAFPQAARDWVEIKKERKRGSKATYWTPNAKSLTAWEELPTDEDRMES